MPDLRTQPSLAVAYASQRNSRNRVRKAAVGDTALGEASFPPALSRRHRVPKSFCNTGSSEIALAR